MDVLVSSVTEILTAAVQEVLQIMGQAVLEHQQEHARTRLENLKLQQMLRELQERCSDEILSSSNPKHEPRPVGVDSRDEIIYEVHLAMSEGALSSERQRDHSLHENHHTDKTTGNQQLSLQGNWENSMKNQKPLSEVKSRSPGMIPNPSPGTRETPVSSSSETTVSSNRIKLESKEHALEPSPTHDRDPVTTQPREIPVQEASSLVGQTQQPVSSINKAVSPVEAPVQCSCTSEGVFSLQNENAVHPGVGVKHRRRYTKHRKTLFLCKVCGQCCQSPSSLKAHLVCHSNEKPFTCQYCTFRSSRSADLKKHERIHTGERLFSCLLCGRMFNRRENLKRHMTKFNHRTAL
ncbi:hypothetical protein DNTS_035203 [Danionella cerebrum]|uniref:C2H2-type domain-containing protein n=1 Tax=Danionella cerebrum TaxID=2873325 RepID=A0A553R7S6_9TELE|nr:hypothetical protein DNTS_035203 [Danionella translucida]